MTPRDKALGNATRIVADKVKRFNEMRRRLSRNDVQVIFLSQLLVELSAGRDVQEVEKDFVQMFTSAKVLVEEIWGRQQVLDSQIQRHGEPAGPIQLRLF